MNAKFGTVVLSLMLCLICIWHETLLAQSTQLSSSAFDMGFGVSSQPSNISARSAAGQSFVGISLQGNTMAGSGILANPVMILSLTSRSCLRVLLEGPYNAGAGVMDKSLKTAGILAAHFPGVAIPAEAVDSITIELRNTVSGPTLRKFCAAWLLADGTIRAFADTTRNYVEFDALAGNYYLVVYHRNHLAIMTGGPQALNSTTPPLFDFTTSQSQAYGTNPMKLVGTKYCMYAGDANASSIVTTADANGVFGSLLASGYLSNDINLSGVVSTADANIVFANLLVGSQVTSAVVNSGDVAPTKANRKTVTKQH